MDEARASTEARPIWTRIVDASESRWRAGLLGAGATALTLVGSFLNFVNYNAYPAGSPEVLLVLAAMLGAAIVAGVVAATLGVFGQIVFSVLLTVLAIEANFDGKWLYLGIVASVLLARFSRQALILLFGVVVVSEAWTAMSGTGEAHLKPLAAAADVDLNAHHPDIALVHVILDEHIGLEGIPRSEPQGPEMRERLQAFYVDHGFRILGGAYSESLHTVNSIPRILSLADGGTWKQGVREGTHVEQSAYFDALQAMGFRITVVQSDWIDYCQHPAADRCMTRVAGSLIDVGDRLPVTDKAAILAYRFAALSTFATAALGTYDIVAYYGRRFGISLPIVQMLQQTGTSPLNGMTTMEWTIDEARALTPGRAIFAHVLLPHYPYVYDRDCSIKRFSKWLGRGSVAPRSARYAAYFDQVACATRKVEDMLSAVAASPAAGKTVFILHGDHGSRITVRDPTVENEGVFSDRDLVDGLAAFFAVSTPEIAPGYDTGRYPLRLILDALVHSQFQVATPDLPSSFVHTMEIEDRRWNPVSERSIDDRGWWVEESEEPTNETGAVGGI